MHLADSSYIPSPHNGDKTNVFGPSQDENLTMVVPGSAMSQTRAGEQNTRPGSGDSALGSIEDENFTMVMPQASMGFGKSISGTKSTQKAKLGSESSINPTPQKDQRDNDVVVYEDSSAAQGDQPTSSETANDVLEELPVNEQYQNLPNHNTPHGVAGRGLASVDDDGSHSTSKANSTAPGQDRADVLKNRRILSSGVDRLNSKSLDALGFRRLQELVKSTSKDPDVHLSGLLHALLEYLEAPNEALKVNATKAQSLKSQALTTIRAVAALHSRDTDIRQLFAQALCSVLTAKKMTEGISYMAIDLEKTADEMAKLAGDQTWSCVDRLAEVGEMKKDSGDAVGHRKMTTMLLGILTKLLANARTRHDEIQAVQRSRLGKLAVKFLDDEEADVRRADTELCVELHDTFESADRGSFWGLLEGAREPQLNLVAYYLARRAQAG